MLGATLESPKLVSSPQNAWFLELAHGSVWNLESQKVMVENWRTQTLWNQPIWCFPGQTNKQHINGPTVHSHRNWVCQAKAFHAQHRSGPKPGKTFGSKNTTLKIEMGEAKLIGRPALPSWPHIFFWRGWVVFAFSLVWRGLFPGSWVEKHASLATWVAI